MTYLQYLIGSLILFITLSANAVWLTEPYLGYGQLSLQLGNIAMVDGESTGYTLGARTGLQAGPLFFGADYSRSGPYHMTFKNSYYGSSIDSGLFTVFSGGLGVKYTFGSWMLWIGKYPYHFVEEHKIDFQLKGAMDRVGLGWIIDQHLNLYFQYETSTLELKSPSTTSLMIFCYNTPSDDCSHSGKTSTISFILSANVF